MAVSAMAVWRSISDNDRIVVAGFKGSPVASSRQGALRAQEIPDEDRTEKRQQPNYEALSRLLEN